MQDRWFLASAGRSSENRVRRARAAKEGLRFGKSAPFSLHPLHRRYPRDEMLARSLSLSFYGYLSRDEDGRRRRQSVGERQKKLEGRGTDREARRWTRRDERRRERVCARGYVRVHARAKARRASGKERERESVRGEPRERPKGGAT